MLAIDEWAAVQRFACLKEFAVAGFPDGRRIETEHADERQARLAAAPAKHAHPPVWRDDIVAAAAAALMIDLDDNLAVRHEMPCRGGILRRRGHALQHARERTEHEGHQRPMGPHGELLPATFERLEQFERFSGFERS